jgi:uncharacterized membrane protein YdjX (TVP38/TMEM64 family)
MKLRVPVPTLLTAVAVVAAVAAYLAVPALHRAVDDVVHILTVGDHHAAIVGFRRYLLQFGPWAPAVSALLMVFQSVIAPLPAFVVTFTNGLLFGWAWGALLSWSSAMLGAALCYAVARGLGRPVVERLVGGTKALEISDLFFRRYGSRAILVARLLPFVSFDLISYGAGLTTTTLWRFLLATGLGQLPATLLYSYLGENLTGSARVLFWVFSITTVLFVAGWSLGPVVLRRLRAVRPVAAPAAAAGAAEE